MTAARAGPSFEPDLPFNTEPVCRLQRSVGGVGVELSGSIYTVPPAHRSAVAQLLAEQKIWVHADVFADARAGVSQNGHIRLIADLEFFQHGAPVFTAVPNGDEIKFYLRIVLHGFEPAAAF